MKHALAVLSLYPLLLLSACSGSLDTQFVGAEQSTYKSFGPIAARDAAAGHPSTAVLYDAWGINVAKAVAATQPAGSQ
jgi:hypothetical protein